MIRELVGKKAFTFQILKNAPFMEKLQLSERLKLSICWELLEPSIYLLEVELSRSLQYLCTLHIM